MVNEGQPAGRRRTMSPEEEALSFAVDAARVAHDGKVEDVAVIDLRGLSSLADFFVIGTGTSSRQMHAALDQIARHAKSAGRKVYRVSDTRTANWILADYVDVVIHLFDAEHRVYYDLDGLWGDAPRVNWQAAPAGSNQAAG
ncbi:MAG: ribosome silencing factor [Phycisphaerae bacterium]|nr:ribosome silencing factor [Phycisphaerae bacterium]MCZ2398289.1 ribosome silencing factor [Phycisphaerae bacterium]